MINKHSRFMLSDITYNIFKNVVQVTSPLFSALYFLLSILWELPNALQVLGITAFVTIFISMVLWISHKEYKRCGAIYDGKMEITPGIDKTIYSLLLEDDLENLGKKKSITLKVEPHSHSL